MLPYAVVATRPRKARTMGGVDGMVTVFWQTGGWWNRGRARTEARAERGRTGSGVPRMWLRREAVGGVTAGREVACGRSLGSGRARGEHARAAARGWFGRVVRGGGYGQRQRAAWVRTCISGIRSDGPTGAARVARVRTCAGGVRSCISAVSGRRLGSDVQESNSFVQKCDLRPLARVRVCAGGNRSCGLALR